jgi:hypothetical protein
MKIRGNTVGTPTPRPDWNQTDPTKADYIRNKPDLSNIGGGTGENGATFTPTITDGVLSWTNDKGLVNPDPINIIGPQGEQGPQGEPGVPGANGRTPVKGTDYYTPEELEAVAEYAAGKVTPVTYTLTKNDNGDIVLSGSDGSVCEVQDEVGDTDTTGMNMLVNSGDLSTTTFSTTNTLWRFAIVEVASSTNTTSYVECIVTAYHSTGTYKIHDTDYTVSGQGTVYLTCTRSGDKTTWSIIDGVQSGYKITRVRAYR